MMVANSFDLWKKDVFFPAAEEVQESADIMESTYRAWTRERKKKVASEDLNELCSELQTALGTAKWQLEEFEKAVRLSYRQRGDDNTTARHRQFISAIENQIRHVETALCESFSVEGKKQLRWVHLDEEECDDLAAFLSGTSHGSIPRAKTEYVELGPVKSFEENHIRRKDADLKSNAACKLDNSDEINGVNDVVITIKDPSFVVELKGKDMSGARDDLIYHGDRATNTRKTWSSQNFGDLRVIVADEAAQRTKLITGFEDTPKEKGSKLVFWRRCGESHQAKVAVNLLKLFGKLGASQKQSQSPQKRWHSPLRIIYGRPVQLTLALMLTIFLLVPFVFYSS